LLKNIFIFIINIDNKASSDYPKLLLASLNFTSASLHSFLSVLVLAGIELIFFTVASTRLRFGFVLKMVLIIQGYFCYYYVVFIHS